MAKRPDQSLASVGEFGLIDRITRMIDRAMERTGSPSSRTRARSAADRRVVLGPGDDAAVLRPPAGRDLVVTTDSLVEDVHFRFRTQPARTIGRRALVANLSDLAAMGAEPLGFVAALCAPGSLPLGHAEDLVRGLLDEASAHACPLVGGNVSAARETSISITAFGTVKPGCALRRDNVRAGDRIFVTGTLGGAALAVARAEREGVSNKRIAMPRLRAGRVLGRMTGVGGCIDVSDGLVADLGHLLSAPGLGAEIDLASVPRPRGFAAACARLGLDPVALSAAGGEDYELLFTLREETRTTASALSVRLGVPVSEIGRATPARGIRGVPANPGWRHFSEPLALP